MNNFEESLAFTLTMEGGYVNHPDDPGGATNKGVTQVTYDTWRERKSLPRQDVRLITDGEVSAIYHDGYWIGARCHVLPFPVSLAHFDAAVNHGPKAAIQILQEAAGVAQDGVIGPVTLRAVLHTDDLLDEMLWARLGKYYRICQARPQSRVFLLGWVRRLLKLRTETKEVDHD